MLRCERLARQWHARGQGFKSPQLHQAQRIGSTPIQGGLGGVPPMVEKRAEAGSRDGILCGRHDRLVDHLLLEW
jgi:hypothetical protein